MARAPRKPHDQLLKEALSAFLEDFVTLFAPQQAGQLDFSTVRFLDKEVFTDLAAGQRREMDLLAEVKTQSGTLRLVLIHVEIQRRREAGFAARMLHYFMSIHLRFPTHLILPMALVSYATTEGIGVGHYTMEVEGFTALHYQYIQISLANLDASDYIIVPQALGVGLAALMRKPRRGQRDRLYEACLRRLTELELAGTVDEARLFVLQNMVRTYIDLTAEERTRLLARLEQEGATEVRTTELTWADRVRSEGRAEGKVEGRAEGKVEGKAEDVLVVLRERLKSVPTEIADRVRATSDPQELEALLVRALRVARPEDLFR